MKKEKKLRATDSNLHLTIQIPHKEHEERTEERIRILYTTIRIPKTGVLKNKARQFKSSSYGFESLGKSKGRRLKVRESDSNLRVTDSNPSWRKIQISLRRFESPTQRFESLLAQNSNFTQTIRIPYTTIRIPHGAKFKSRSGDSNPLNNDSNPWFCRSIKCATCNSSYPIFKSNLSHNG